QAQLAATEARIAATQLDIEETKAKGEKERLDEFHAKLSERQAKLAQIHVGIEAALADEQKRLMQAELARGKREKEEPLDQRQPLRLIRISGLSEEARKDLLSRLPVREGSTITKETLEKVTEAARQFDQHLEVNLGHEHGGGVGLWIHPAGMEHRFTF